jgi:hypothetical protein
MTIEYKDSKRIVGLEADFKITPESPATYEVTDTSGTQTLYQNFSQAYISAQKVGSGSVLVGKRVSKLELHLYKIGSPTGTATAGVWNGSGELQYTFGTIDVSTLTTATNATLYTFNNTDSTHVFSANEYFGISYNTGGNSSNKISVYHDDSSPPFDGTNSVWSRYNGSWTDFTSVDNSFKLYLATDGSKPTDVQDNSLLIEKDTARRYWGTDKVTTEEVYNYTTAPSTSNKLSGTPTAYSADACGVELVSSTFAGKYIKTGKWMLKRVGTLGSNAFMKVQDSSGTVKATSAGIAASTIGTSAFEYVTFTLPTAVELANGDRVYIEYTGADTSGDYLALGEKHPSTTPTGWEFTIYNLRDNGGNNPSGVWGDDGLPTALVPTATFDSAPASNVTSDSITWTWDAIYIDDDFSSDSNWTSTGSGATVTSGEVRLYHTGSSNAGHILHQTVPSFSSKAYITFDFIVTSRTSALDAPVFCISSGTGIPQTSTTDNSVMFEVNPQDTTGRVSLREKLGSGSLNTIIAQGDLGGYAVTGTRYYVKISIDDTTITVTTYTGSLSGSQVGSASGTISAITGRTIVKMGTWSNSLSRTHDIKLDNLKIYNGVTSI